jgi:glycerophosphoryl diester phosphodiesterase
MRYDIATIVALAAIAVASPLHADAQSGRSESGVSADRDDQGEHKGHSVQLGPRPFFLVRDMRDGALKRKLESCAEGPFKKTSFSIGHRGAALQFPEHTRESYVAAARMGAGIVECDVTFTKDLELVCRHAQNDLHTTTNILVTPLAGRCSVPFTPADIAPDGTLLKAAAAECRTSDITLAEFRTLTGKMDSFNPRAKTPAEFLGGTPNFRTDLYSGPTSGHLMTHRESIQLFKELGVQMTPELKSPSVPMPFQGFTQQAFAQKMIDEYRAEGVPASDVFRQSFDFRDVLYWIDRTPAFGRQAVYLDDANTPDELPTAADLLGYKKRGINIVGSPIFALVALNSSMSIVPSPYAQAARAAGLDIIAWTLERSGVLADGGNGFYFQTVDAAITREGDTMRVLDVLARGVGIRGIFSDWPATVTYYANCMGLD